LWLVFIDFDLIQIKGTSNSQQKLTSDNAKRQSIALTQMPLKRRFNIFFVSAFNSMLKKNHHGLTILSHQPTIDGSTIILDMKKSAIFIGSEILWRIFRST